MKEYRYLLADVFTNRIFGGNQLAVFPQAQGMDPAYMPQIARELNLSEVVFVLPPDDPSHTRRIRIFTPGMELPFAGHPTLGTACLLVYSEETQLEAEQAKIALEEGVGPIRIEVRRESKEIFWAKFQVAKLPEYGPLPPQVDAIATLLSIDVADIRTDDYQPQAVSCGVPFLFVTLKNREVLARVKLNLAVWEQQFASFWAPHLYVIAFDPQRPGSDLRARMFAPAMNIAEDPATGAAASALAGYLGKREGPQQGVPRWVVEQGFEMGRPSIIEVEARKEQGRVSEIWVGGSTVVVGQGSLSLP